MNACMFVCMYVFWLLIYACIFKCIYVYSVLADGYSPACVLFVVCAWREFMYACMLLGV
jgi:hypothetical protein